MRHINGSPSRPSNGFFESSSFTFVSASSALILVASNTRSGGYFKLFARSIGSGRASMPTTLYPCTPSSAKCKPSTIAACATHQAFGELHTQMSECTETCQKREHSENVATNWILLDVPEKPMVCRQGRSDGRFSSMMNITYASFFQTTSFRFLNSRVNSDTCTHQRRGLFERHLIWQFCSCPSIQKAVFCETPVFRDTSHSAGIGERKYQESISSDCTKKVRL